MTNLEKLIEVLGERAADSDLLALLGTSREVRLYNAALARELRDVVETLRREGGPAAGIGCAAIKSSPN